MKNPTPAQARKALKSLVSALALPSDSFDIRANKVNGTPMEITLHAEHLYIQVSMNPYEKPVLVRSCKNRKDYGGTNNNMATMVDLESPRFAERCKPLIEAKGNGICFLRP